MERPERPTRHKSHPISVKFPVRPIFSSDSESELNDSDVGTGVRIHVNYYNQPESSSVAGGPSTSSTVPQASQTNQESSPQSNLLRLSPEPLTLSPMPREDEPRAEPQQESARRKRSAASSAAASVIFDSVDTLIGSNNSERPTDRFQHSDFVIRPRSFSNLAADCGNAIAQPPLIKLKRLSGPIDLTPSTSARDPPCHPPVVTSSFSLRDNSSLPTNSESSSSFFNRSSNIGPYGLPPRDHPSSSTSAGSSILRQFDEMCSTSPIIRRKSRAGLSVRFLDSGRFGESSTSDAGNNTPLIPRNTTWDRLDDYCDLVGNFLFNSSSPLNDNRRSPDRGTSSEPQSSNTADIISRHVNSTPDHQHSGSQQPSLLGDFNSHLSPLRTVLVEVEQMEQSNDDVIVVETPERPPLPDSPDALMGISCGSPVPTAPTTQATPTAAPSAPASNPAKSRSNRNTDVPMTLQELNQTLVSLLECPVCLDHATPPIYQCGKGHILCQSCHPRLSTCPICRSRLPGDRNSTMEKVAEKLMYPCKNTVTGCSMMLKLDDKQEHEEGCGFRHYPCIVSTCHWKGYKPELVVHLQSNHPDRLVLGANKVVHVPVPNSVAVGGSMFISHHWIQSAHNEVFNVIFHVDLYKKIMKGCVIYMGSPDKAERFVYEFELAQRVPPFRKLSFSRTTHADSLRPGAPLCLSNDFSINVDMARLYRPGDCAAGIIPVTVNITHHP